MVHNTSGIAEILPPAAWRLCGALVTTPSRPIGRSNGPPSSWCSMQRMGTTGINVLHAFDAKWDLRTHG